MDASMLVELPPTAFAFAYGSAVFRQASYADEQFRNAMLDLILAVDDPLAWHRENIERNRSHYSFLASLGPGVVARVQESFGARIYYNPYVRLGNREAKYGVISTAHLLQDLTHWETLYVSGRMHKPVAVLRHNDAVVQAAVENCINAVRTALLMLPETFTRDELFESIVGLSYTGDFRMTIGENKNKIRNIVSAGRARFDELYAAPMQSLGQWITDGGSRLKQDVSLAATRAHIEQLPRELRSRLPSDAARARSRSVVQAAVGSIVRRSSTTQSLKGVVSAGVARTARYSAAKLAKMK